MFTEFEFNKTTQLHAYFTDKEKSRKVSENQTCFYTGAVGLTIIIKQYKFYEQFLSTLKTDSSKHHHIL
jgi:hypothetical protein